MSQHLELVQVALQFTRLRGLSSTLDQGSVGRLQRLQLRRVTDDCLQELSVSVDCQLTQPLMPLDPRIRCFSAWCGFAGQTLKARSRLDACHLQFHLRWTTVCGHPVLADATRRAVGPSHWLPDWLFQCSSVSLGYVRYDYFRAGVDWVLRLRWTKFCRNWLSTARCRLSSDCCIAVPRFDLDARIFEHPESGVGWVPPTPHALRPSESRCSEDTRTINHPGSGVGWVPAAVATTMDDCP
jgi:hypothetical protein